MHTHTHTHTHTHNTHTHTHTHAYLHGLHEQGLAGEGGAQEAGEEAAVQSRAELNVLRAAHERVLQARRGHAL